MTKSNQKLAAQAVEIAKTYVGRSLIRPGGPGGLTPRDVIETGKQLRESQLYKLPILPGAVNIFIQLASSREWAVSGRPRSVSRAVEWINNAETFDPYTGQVYTGFQQFLQRRAMDYLTIGRTTFVVRKSSGSPLEYVDPAFLRFSREKQNFDQRLPVRPSEKVWMYYNETQYRSDEVFLDHPLPIGTHLFISPIAYLLPSAHLAWLLREHTASYLDGRKIRDIIIVGNPQLAEGIEKAIHQMAALWSGESVDRVGIPVVEASISNGQSLDDYITRLGLSEIPTKFDEFSFTDAYVNQISAALGLALRQFWNNEKTTNRALEEVQEQRQQQKGPSYFIRTEQRLINNSKILSRFGEGVNKVRFGFIEETDLSTKLNDAQVLYQTSQALKEMYDVFGDTITSQSYLRWMQNLGTLPYEVELSGNGRMADNGNNIIRNGDIGSASNTDEEQTRSGDESPTAFSKFLKHGEVTMNQDGQILERRNKMFSVLKFILNESYQERLREEQPMSDEEAFDVAIKAAEKEVQDLFCEAYEEQSDVIDLWVRTQILFDTDLAQQAIQKCYSKQELNSREQEVIDSLVVNLDLER